MGPVGRACRPAVKLRLAVRSRATSARRRNAATSTTDVDTVRHQRQGAAVPSNDGESNKQGREGLFTKVGAIATALGAVIAAIALIPALFGTSGDASSVSPPPPPPIEDRPSASKPPTTSAPNIGFGAPPSSSITKFEIVPDEFQQVGPNSFKAYRNSQLDFVYKFIVEANGDSISPCTISSKITNIVTGEVIEPSAASCPSESYIVKKALKVGSYRIDATAYAPELNISGETSYDFSIVP
jgi:hypothetical protein